jgi:hypothetical protein
MHATWTERDWNHWEPAGCGPTLTGPLARGRVPARRPVPRHQPRPGPAHALAAERAGFDGVWIAEHHFLPYGTCPSALALAAHLLGATARIRVGTAACILSSSRAACCPQWTAGNAVESAPAEPAG